MSQENVEVVRAVFEAQNRGDVEAALEYAAPDVEFDFSRALGLQGGIYKRDQLVPFFEEFTEPWESIRWEVGEVVEGGDQVVVEVFADFRGRQGIEVRATSWQVWRIRSGLVVHACWYAEDQREEALEAAGLANSKE